MERAGERLKKMRLDKGETQQQVADAVGVTKQAVQYYESGKRIPHDDIKIKLTKHFNRSVGFIFT